MEQLIVQSRQLLGDVSPDFKRHLFEEIQWDERLIGIVGGRGTGKTTMLLQRMNQSDSGGKQSIYLSLDDIYFTENKLIDVLRKLSALGFNRFYIDEVHQYQGWSREIKNAYDFHRDMTIVFTGSSIIDIKKEGVDLSRRAAFYTLNGLSYREFVNLKTNRKLKTYSLEDILKRHGEIAQEITSEIKPLSYWQEYLEKGYYPYFMVGSSTYHSKLRRIINTVVESDLRFIKSVSTQNTEKIKKLLHIISGSVPFKPNMSKLSERIGIHRNTLAEYLHYLEEGKLVNMLTAKGKSTGLLSKPDKLYLENTNIAYALIGAESNRGNARETFFLNQLKSVAEVRLPDRGDFIINDRYIVEVGGSRKTQKQIRDLKEAYIASDDIEMGALNRIPLWLFGFLY